MSDSKEYILRKPLSDDEQSLLFAEGMPSYTFRKVFVEFDREQLKQQLVGYLEKSEILLSLFLEGREPGTYYTASVDEATHEIADSVLALIVGEKP